MTDDTTTSTTAPALPESASLGDTSVATNTSAEDPPQQSPRLSAMVMPETMTLVESDDDKPKPAKAKISKTRSTGEAVSVERKEELLLEARVNRLQWIHQVPLPYRKAESPDDPWVQEKGLATFLQSCHAAAMMPSMTKVLGHLYGMNDKRVSPEEVAMRIENLVSIGKNCWC